VKLAIALGGLSAGNLTVAFLTQSYVLLLIGASGATDAYFAASAVPQLLLTIATGSLGYVLIPLLSGEKPEETAQDIWAFLIVIGGFFAILALALGALAPAWFPLAAPGLAERDKALGIDLLRIQLPSLVLTILYVVLAAALHAQQRFIWAELSPLLAAIVGFGLALWVVPRYGVVGAAWVIVARSALQAGLVCPVLSASRGPSLLSPRLRQAWQRLRPLLFGVVYTKSDPVVDRFLASMTPAGGLTLLTLAQQMVVSGAVVLGAALSAPALPALSLHAKRHNWSAFESIYRRRATLVVGAAGLAIAVIVLVGAVALPYTPSLGKLTLEDERALWMLVLLLSGVLLGGSAGTISSSGFYATGDTLSPVVIGVVASTAGILLKVIGFALGGLVGIAVGTTCYYLVLATLLHVILGRSIRRRQVLG
jgi:peptidoglycan biosynthesis protein MviN/MurJ (putative lipid II flippase)